MRQRLILVGAAAMALSACERTGDAEQAAATPATAATGQDALIGLWTSDAPAEFVGEGLRSRMADGRTAYGADRRFAYQGRLTIFGPELRNDGMSFAVTARGDWRRQGDRLSEDFTEVRVVPEHEDGELRRLADQLAGEMTEAPPTVSRIAGIEDGRLTLLTEDGREATYTRR